MKKSERLNDMMMFLNNKNSLTSRILWRDTIYLEALLLEI